MLNTKILFRYENFFVFAFFFVLSFFYIGANIFSNQIAAPMDLLMQYPGFSDSGISVPKLQNPQTSDVLDGWLPNWIFIKDEVTHGNFPFWNPFRDGGVPAILPSPPAIAMFLRIDFLPFFLLGNGIGFTVGKILILTIMGFGAYKLCREQFEIIPSLFSGITFLMSGVVALWLPTIVDCAIMWIPWFLWSLKRVIDRPSFGRVAMVSIFTLMMVIGDFPFLSFIGLCIGIIFILWNFGIEFLKDKRVIKKPLAYVLIGSILGLGLSSIYVFPFIGWEDHSNVSWRTGGTNFSMNDIDVLWLPFKYANQYNDHLVPSYEKSDYIGKVTILLLPISIIGILLEKKKYFSIFPLFWILISVFLIIIIFNIYPLSSFIYHLPIFDQNSSGRSIALLGLTLSILAAYALQKIIVWMKQIGKIIENEKIFKIIAFLSVTVFLVIQVADLSINRVPIAVVPSDTFFPSTPTLEYVKGHLIPGQSIIATDAYMISGSLTGYEIPEWFAQDLLNPQEKETLSHVVDNAWKDPFSASFPLSEVNLHSSYMNALFVRYVLASKDQVQKNLIPDNWHILEKDKNIDILENMNCPPGAYLIPYSMNGSYDQSAAKTNGIKILKYSTDYFEYLVTSNNEDRFVIPLHFWPDWKAYVNGKAVTDEPYLNLLSSVKIESGQSIVEFRYEPISLQIGIVLSLTSAVILLSLWFYEHRMKKK